MKFDGIRIQLKEVGHLPHQLRILADAGRHIATIFDAVAEQLAEVPEKYCQECGGDLQSDGMAIDISKQPAEFAGRVKQCIKCGERYSFPPIDERG